MQAHGAQREPPPAEASGHIHLMYRVNVSLWLCAFVVDMLQPTPGIGHGREHSNEDAAVYCHVLGKLHV